MTLPDDLPPGAKFGRPSTFGWMRRSDLEDPSRPGHVWERPDGKLIGFDRGADPVIIKNPPGAFDQDY